MGPGDYYWGYIGTTLPIVSMVVPFFGSTIVIVRIL